MHHLLWGWYIHPHLTQKDRSQGACWRPRQGRVLSLEPSLTHPKTTALDCVFPLQLPRQPLLFSAYYVLDLGFITVNF